MTTTEAESNGGEGADAYTFEEDDALAQAREFVKGTGAEATETHVAGAALPRVAPFVNARDLFDAFSGSSTLATRSGALPVEEANATNAGSSSFTASGDATATTDTGDAARPLLRQLTQLLAGAEDAGALAAALGVPQHTLAALVASAESHTRGGDQSSSSLATSTTTSSGAKATAGGDGLGDGPGHVYLLRLGHTELYRVGSSPDPHVRAALLQARLQGDKSVGHHYSLLLVTWSGREWQHSKAATSGTACKFPA